MKSTDTPKECMVFDALIFYDSGRREKFEFNLIPKDVDKLRETIKIISGAKEVRLRYEEVDKVGVKEVVEYEKKIF